MKPKTAHYLDVTLDLLGLTYNVANIMMKHFIST